MKKLLILFGIILSIGLSAQIPGDPDASGVITPGPPDYATGLPVGDGEMKLQLKYAGDRTDSAKAVFNYVDSTAFVDSITTNAIHYTEIYWDDLRVPLTNTMINPALSEPDFEDRGDGLFAWGFDSNADSTHVLNFTAQIPHPRADSSDIEVHLHWQPDGTNTDDVVWKIIYSTANEGGSFTAPDTIRVVDAADGVTLKYQAVEFGTLAGSDTLRISAGIVGSIARMGEAADDTYTGTAFGIELDFHYQINSPGSKGENSKY